jgi:hypothetical protein
MQSNLRRLILLVALTLLGLPSLTNAALRTSEAVVPMQTLLVLDRLTEFKSEDSRFAVMILKATPIRAMLAIEYDLPVEDSFPVVAELRSADGRVLETYDATMQTTGSVLTISMQDAATLVFVPLAELDDATVITQDQFLPPNVVPMTDGANPIPTKTLGDLMVEWGIPKPAVGYVWCGLGLLVFGLILGLVRGSTTHH